MNILNRLGAALGLATKSAVPVPVSAASAPPPWLGLMLGGGELSARQAWMLYKNVATLARVVDLIADQVAHLPPILEIDGQAVQSHPILNLLAKPGYNRTRRRFIKEMVVEILTSGYCPVHVIGSGRAVPVGLDVLRTQHIVYQQDSDGWPKSFHVSEPTRGMTFQREGGLNFRYADGPVSELLPIYDMAGDDKGIGLSRLQAVRNDVELRARAVIHNRALVDKGARLSGILNYSDTLTDEQLDAVQKSIERTVAGNAGSIMVTSGGDAHFSSVAMTPRDMDWGTLTGLVDDAIAARYNVPVTLFNVKAQTNNNYETAWRMLFDNAVLPTFTIVYEALAQLFSARLGAEIAFKPDRLSVPILAEQSASNATKLHGAGLITRNEARNDIGMEPSIGGDDFYISAGLVPAGEDFFTEVDRRLGRAGGAGDDSEAPELEPAEGTGDEDDAPPAKAPAQKRGSNRGARERRLN